MTARIVLDPWTDRGSERTQATRDVCPHCARDHALEVVSTGHGELVSLSLIHDRGPLERVPCAAAAIWIRGLLGHDLGVHSRDQWEALGLALDMRDERGRSARDLARIGRFDAALARIRRVRSW